MYIARGWNPTEIGDIDVIVHEGRLHLFHLNVSGHDVVSHLVSDDGMRWQQLPNALRTGDPGEADDDQIWTMHAFRWQGRFYMLYTCLAQAEDGRLQRTGLAVSDDLIAWEKVPHNPVAEPDPRWYEADLSASGRADWRDPSPWIEDSVIHGLICAHEKDGPFNRRGCVAHITSTDAAHWQVRPPFYTPRISTDFEVPCVFRLGGRYYLLGHICAPPIDVYRVAASLDGPWQRPMDDVLLPKGNHAFHACEWRGKVLVFHWIAAEADWRGDGQGTRVIAPPKVAEAGPDGRLALRPFGPAWDAAAAGEWLARTASDVLTNGSACEGAWRAEGAVLVAESAPGMGVHFLGDELADFELEVTIRTDTAPEVGLVFRSDATADECTRVACIAGRCRTDLVRVRQGRNYNAVGRGYEMLQTRFTPLEAGKAFHLRVAAYGPYVEASVDGSVRLSMLTMARRSGGVGLFLEDGAARFSDLRVRALEAPAMRLPLGPVAT